MISHIANESNRPAALQVIKFLNLFVDFILLASANTDVQTCTQQSFGDPAADASRSASYDCSFTV
jgi:hypothetical protein